MRSDWTSEPRRCLPPLRLAFVIRVSVTGLIESVDECVFLVAFATEKSESDDFSRAEMGKVIRNNARSFPGRRQSWQARFLSFRLKSSHSMEGSSFSLMCSIWIKSLETILATLDVFY